VKHWTEVEIERLRYLAAKGLTAAVIAARLGRTRAAVLFKGRKSGIRFGPGRVPSTTLPAVPESGARACTAYGTSRPTSSW
jgi:hypothetical protein